MKLSLAGLFVLAVLLAISYWAGTQGISVRFLTPTDRSELQSCLGRN